MKKSSILLVVIMLSTLAFAQKAPKDYKLLGYGYDVFGKYASPESVKDYCLFDMNKIPKGWLIKKEISSSDNYSTEGSSIQDYSQNLSAHVGLNYEGFLFKGGIQSDFSSASENKEEYYYFTEHGVVKNYRITFDERIDIKELKKYLQKDFAYDIEYMDATKLINTYGAFYIGAAYIGGRMDVASYTKVTSTTKTENISVQVKAKYKNISGDAGAEYRNSGSSNNSNTTINIFTVGGDRQYTNSIPDNKAYSIWYKGIKGNDVLCDFPKDQKPLRPIWELASTTARQKEIKEAFDMLCKSNPLPEPPPSVIIPDQVKAGTEWKSQAYSQTILKSDDGRYSLVLQDDGNVVLYNQNSKALWALGTSGKTIDNLQFQSDGNLVLYGAGGVALWASGTVGADKLVLQGDGNLVIYQGTFPRYASQSDKNKRID